MSFLHFIFPRIYILLIHCSAFYVSLYISWQREAGNDKEYFFKASHGMCEIWLFQEIVSQPFTQEKFIRLGCQS